MKTVNVHEAKTHLSRLLEAVAAGEEVIIAKSGKPVARLVEYREKRPRRIPGAMKGKIKIMDNFDDPLPPEIGGPLGADT